MANSTLIARLNKKRKQQDTWRAEQKDCRGVSLAVGDLVAIGHDNGSSLIIGNVEKLTTCYVWITNPVRGTYLNRRDYMRVVKIEL